MYFWTDTKWLMALQVFLKDQNSWGIINSMYSINISGCGQGSDFSLPLFSFPNMYIIKFYFLKRTQMKPNEIRNLRRVHLLLLHVCSCTVSSQCVQSILSVCYQIVCNLYYRSPVEPNVWPRIKKYKTLHVSNLKAIYFLLLENSFAFF